MHSNEGPAPGTELQQGVVVVVHRAGRFLMIRRAAGIVAGGGWCFVGGAIKPGETQPEAVAREFSEEVHGCVHPEQKVWEYQRPDGNLLLHWWLAKIEAGPLHPNEFEVAELRWCTPDEIESLPNVLQGNLQFVRQIGRALVEA